MSASPLRILGAAAAACASLGLLPAGCAQRGPHTTTIVDDGPARLMEARRLASEAQAEQRSGHSDRAIELYQQSLAQSKELGFVWNNLGLLYMEKDNYLDAVDMFQSAADLMPESAKPCYNIGLAYSRRGHDGKALEFYGKALERDPRDGDALRGAVLSAKRLDRADEAALERVRRALMTETDPRWKRLEESEQFRIEGALRQAKESAPMALPVGGPAGLGLESGEVVAPAPAALPESPAPAPAGEPAGGGAPNPEPPPASPPATPPGR